MSSWVVLVTSRLEMFIGDPGDTTAVVLLQDGTVDPLPDALVGADDATIAAHYGVDEVVRSSGTGRITTRALSKSAVVGVVPPNSPRARRSVGG